MHSITQRISKIATVAACSALLLAATAAPALASDRRSSASVFEAVDLRVRSGAGSLFGPGFDTGQPSYAREQIIDTHNRSPFSTLRQSGMTFGVAASGEVHTGDRWSVGATALAGFNATSARRGGITDDMQAREKLQGVSYGGGLRASYGDARDRVSLDVVYTQTRLHGWVDWSVDETFSSGASGEARYSYDVRRVAAMVGYEFAIAGPFFGFVQGGAQFLPRQTSRVRQEGSVPDAPHDDGFGDIGSRRLDTMDERVTFHPELQYGLGLGLGVTF
jgi:hypothetical protein